MPGGVFNQRSPISIQQRLTNQRSTESPIEGCNMISRRVFVKSGAMAMVSLGFAPSFLARTAEAATGRKRLLIAIFQRGAVDGLNMIVPYGEADYYRLRPSIAIPKPGAAEGAIDL